MSFARPGERTALILACATVAVIGGGMALAAWLRSPDRLAPVTWAAYAPPPDVPLKAWKAIVVHHSATRAGDVARFDRAHEARGWDGIGYHFVIGNGNGMPMGAIEPTFRWTEQKAGAHAGVAAWNNDAIGICLVGDFDQDRPHPYQEARLAELIAVLIRQCPTLSVRAVGGHRDIPGKQTKCPGRFLDVAHVRQLVQDRLAAPSVELNAGMR